MNVDPIVLPSVDQQNEIAFLHDAIGAYARCGDLAVIGHFHSPDGDGVVRFPKPIT